MIQRNIYKDLSLADFQIHIRHLAENLEEGNLLEIRIEDINIVGM